jgi:cytoskeletal protein CcmA (bactofilin family)
MNHQRACTAALLALAVAFTASAMAHDDDDITGVSNSITVGAGEHRGNLKTVNGSIRVGEGSTVGDAHTVNGSIKLESHATAAEAKTVNGSVSLGEGAKVSGAVASVNGSLKLEPGADVSGGLANVNGGIHVNAAHVGGDVTGLNGGMEIGPDARIDGGILVRKSHSDHSEQGEPPHIIIGPGSVVKGPLKFERDVKLYVSDRATIGPVEGATPVKFSGDRPTE